MRQRYSGISIVLFALIALIGYFAGNAFAQSAVPTAPATAATQAPTLNETEQLMVQLVALQARLATCESNGLDSMKAFTATRADVVKRVESSHPGYTLDLQTGKLVEKKK